MQMYLCSVTVLLALFNVGWADDEPYPNLSCHKEFDSAIGGKNIKHFMKFCEEKKDQFLCFKECYMHLTGIVARSGKGQNKAWKQQSVNSIAKGFERFFFKETQSGKNLAAKMANEMRDKCEELLNTANKWSKKEMQVKNTDKIGCNGKEWIAYFKCIDDIWNCKA